MRKILLCFFLLLLFTTSFAQQKYYISTTGNNSNIGSITQPWLTLSRVNGALVAGDSVFIRGGTYLSTAGNGASIHFLVQNIIGNASNKIYIGNYPGETPIFSCSNITPTEPNPYLMTFSGCRYLHVKGLKVTFLRQIADGSGVSRGLSLSSSSNCTIDQVEIYNIGGQGMKLENNSNDNLTVSCDIHHNGDGLTAWNTADAYSITGGDLSTRNTLRTSRCYLNSDDGIDFFNTNGINYIEGCWFFWNGYKPWGTSATNVNPATMTAEDPSVFVGNPSYYASSGEGIKAGPASVQNFNLITKYISNCMAFENRGTGYASNSDNALTTRHQYWNCIAFGNQNDGWSYGVGWSAGCQQIWRNCWSYNNNLSISGASWVYDGLNGSISNNVWMSTLGSNFGNLNPPITVTNADFLSVSSAGVTGARQADGSLPNLNFLKLAVGSDLINAGIDVGLPFIGTAPDIGAFEFNSGTNLPPVANAGANQTITLPLNSVTLSGSGTDSDGSISSWLWTKVGSSPVAGGVSNPNTQTSSAINLVQGVYTFELRVTDNAGATDTDDMTVTVNAAPITPPTCTANSSGSITLPTNFAALVMTANSTTGGSISSYGWVKTSGPATGSIQNASLASTQAINLVQGTYVFTGTATDNNGQTCTTVRTIIVNAAPNVAPTANAGADQNITLPTNTATLTGSGSDPDGTITAYLWTKIIGPAGSGITNSTSATATATALTQGIYRFELRVTDNNGAFGRDTMMVTVNAAPVPPTANAGSNKVITLPTNTAAMNGSGTGTGLSYAWVKLPSSPATGTIQNATQAVTAGINLVQGVYSMELTVTDVNLLTAKDTMTITVNAAPNVNPTANAGPDQVIQLPVNSVNLSGSGTDPDGTISAYNWSFAFGSATISNANIANPSVTGLTQGIYRLVLRVTDNNGGIGRDTMQITVLAAIAPPTANAGSDKVITLPINIASLNGSGTGTGIAYLWTKLPSSPTGGNITPSATVATAQANNLIVGTYSYEIRVTDVNATVVRDTMTITVLAATVPPDVSAGADQVLFLPTTSTTLTGTVINTSGTTDSIAWSQISGTAATIGTSTTLSTAITGLSAGVSEFRLYVRDSNGFFDVDTVKITVNVNLYILGIEAFAAHLYPDNSGRGDLGWTFYALKYPATLYMQPQMKKPNSTVFKNLGSRILPSKDPTVKDYWTFFNISGSGNPRGTYFFRVVQVYPGNIVFYSPEKFVVKKK